MSARYIVRLDDACPTMNRANWDRVERALDAAGVKPVVAVIPDNKDKSLLYDPPEAGFWIRVRRWQDKGWAIAMHGLHHVYHPIDRSNLILPFYDRSEVGGLSLEAQSALLRRSLEIFYGEGVSPTVWIAPGHSFDRTTVEALCSVTPIRLISDGLALDPWRQTPMTWIPQQLWSFKRRRAGTWTVCLHPNTATDTELASIEVALRDPWLKSRFTSIDQLAMPYRGRRMRDWIYERGFHMKSSVMRVIVSCLSPIKKKTLG